ncbi:MAG: lysophospholipid acyltransferase family protein [Candidatus Gastranaerophilales bacterium]|nr:lysophospholipid acyltransferase family protein [Candidatus Gastranaerophilales bacterium]
MAFKKKFKDKLKVNIVTFLYCLYILPLDKSLKWQVFKKSDYEGPSLFAVWHGNQFANLSVEKSKRNKHNLLISPSNDGDTIANVSKFLGYSLIRGSIKRRGAEAAREIISSLESGKNVSYTVDGPKGPIYKIKPGIIRLAQMSGVPIVPFVSTSKNYIELPSWDKYNLPMYFDTCIAMYGEPIHIPKELTEEQTKNYQQEIEERMFDLKYELEEMLGKNDLTPEVGI